MFEYSELVLPEVFVYSNLEDRNFFYLSKECASYVNASFKASMSLQKIDNALCCLCALCSAEISLRDYTHLINLNMHLVKLKALFKADSSPLQHVLDFCFLYKACSLQLTRHPKCFQNEKAMIALKEANRLAADLYVESKKLLAFKKNEFVENDFRGAVLNYLATNTSKLQSTADYKPALLVASECFMLSPAVYYLYHTKHSLLAKALVSNFDLDKNIGSEFYLHGPFEGLRKIAAALMLPSDVAQVAILEADLSTFELEAILKLFQPKGQLAFNYLSNVINAVALL